MKLSFFPHIIYEVYPPRGGFASKILSKVYEESYKSAVGVPLGVIQRAETNRDVFNIRFPICWTGTGLFPCFLRVFLSFKGFNETNLISDQFFVIYP